MCRANNGNDGCIKGDGNIARGEKGRKNRNRVKRKGVSKKERAGRGEKVRGSMEAHAH